MKNIKKYNFFKSPSPNPGTGINFDTFSKLNLCNFDILYLQIKQDLEKIQEKNMKFHGFIPVPLIRHLIPISWGVPFSCHILENIADGKNFL